MPALVDVLEQAEEDDHTPSSDFNIVDEPSKSGSSTFEKVETSKSASFQVIDSASHTSTIKD